MCEHPLPSVFAEISPRFRTLTLVALLLAFPTALAARLTRAQLEEPRLVIDPGGHKAIINNIMFTKDGKFLVSVSGDKTIRVWDAQTGETIRTIRGQLGRGDEGKIYAAALSPDNRWLAIGGLLSGIPELRDRIRILNFRTGEVVSLLKGHKNVILGLAFSPDSQKLISGSFDKTARIWDVNSGETLQVLMGHSKAIYAVAFSRDGQRVATGSDDFALKLWQVSSGRLIHTLKGHQNKVKSIAFTDRYLLSGSWDKTIRLWHGKTGVFIRVLAEQDSGVDSLSISPDGRRVLTGIGYGRGYTSYIFSMPDGKKITSFTKHTNIVVATTFSPDGETVATGGGLDHEIYLWSPRNGTVQRKMVGKGAPIWSVGFAKDGKSIAWGKVWERNNLLQYGNLNQSFALWEEGKFSAALGENLKGDSGYERGLDRVGSVSIRTPNGRVHKTLQILRDGEPRHEITRTSTDGYRHRSITLTPDGKKVISGAGNGFLTSYDPNTGEKLRDFIGHTGVVWRVAVSPDSRHLVSGSSDQTVRLWEIESGKLLLTIFHATDGEWVAWIPEGYYTSSVNGDHYIGWHINRGVDRSALYFPASKFAKRFYKPRVVANYLATRGNIEEAIQLANKETPRAQRTERTATADITRLLPPAVFIRTPAETRLTKGEATLRIEAEARSLTGEVIKDIWVTVNGRRADEKRGTKRIEGQRAKIGMTLPLEPGENRIAVIAANQHAQSEPELIVVTRKAQGSTASASGDIFKPNLYVLAVGVSRYANPQYNLNVADKDAEAIAELFRRQEGRLYRQVQVRLLTNEQATRGDLLDGLEWIERQSTQRDVSIIFVAGHGTKDSQGNYYFIPHDGNPEKLRRTSIKWIDFNEVVSNLPSKVLLFTDTCHAGAVTGKRRSLVDITDALKELISTESGTVVMAASTGRELSQERPEWGHGAFTKALLEGLKGRADFNKDKVIDIKELDLYVTNRVKELTEGAQHSTTEIPRIMPNFPLVVN